MKITLLSILCLISISLVSQGFYTEGRDTTFVKDNFKISLIHIPDSIAYDQIWWIERQEYKNPIITDLDSIQNILKKNLIYTVYEDGESATPYLTELLCDNGFRVFLNSPPSSLRYYPVEGVISMGGGYYSVSYTFFLSDGEMTYPPEKMYISSDKMFRWGVLEQCYQSEACSYRILEVYDTEQKGYVRLLNLAEILPYYSSVTDATWLDENYYFYDKNYGTWKVEVQSLKK